MKKIIVFAICAVGFAFAAHAQTTSADVAATKTEDQLAAEKNGTAVATTQSVEKKQCAGASKSCSKSTAGKSCCKAKTGEASATAAGTEKKSCCKDKAAGTAACKGHESAANGEKKSCAKPCCKKAEH
jgi:hypothetical protein